MEECRVDELLPMLLDDHEYLIKDKDINVQICSSEPVTVCAPPMVANIVISNLVRNAIEQTDRGSVEIRLIDGVLLIRNTAPMLSTPEIVENFRQRVREQGSNKVRPGIGLHIIQRLCNRAGWGLSVTSEGDTTTARLDLTATHAQGKETLVDRAPCQPHLDAII